MPPNYKQWLFDLVDTGCHPTVPFVGCDLHRDEIVSSLEEEITCGSDVVDEHKLLLDLEEIQSRRLASGNADSAAPKQVIARQPTRIALVNKKVWSKLREDTKAAVKSICDAIVASNPSILEATPFYVAGSLERSHDQWANAPKYAICLKTTDNQNQLALLHVVDVAKTFRKGILPPEQPDESTWGGVRQVLEPFRGDTQYPWVDQLLGICDICPIIFAATTEPIIEGKISRVQAEWWLAPIVPNWLAFHTDTNYNEQMRQQFVDARWERFTLLKPFAQRLAELAPTWSGQLDGTDVGAFDSVDFTILSKELEPLMAKQRASGSPVPWRNDFPVNGRKSCAAHFTCPERPVKGSVICEWHSFRAEYGGSDDDTYDHLGSIRSPYD